MNYVNLDSKKIHQFCVEKHIFNSLCFLLSLKLSLFFSQIYIKKRLTDNHCSEIIYSTNIQKIIKIQIYKIKTTLLQLILATPHKNINLFTSAPEEEESLVFNRKESWEFRTSSGSLACSGGAGELELLHVPFGSSNLELIKVIKKKNTRKYLQNSS
jgi:hypothetical protein